ncbi:MAG TPA: hypothetical protein DCO83_05045 [Mucilaginibacter sp.]|jgi:hypothetical protein|nr:hypothetical protein [Mucilaginibacter sp.]
MSKETIYIALKLSDKFNVAFPDGFVPEGKIDKTKCRVGITYQAFHEKRHTLIVVPGAGIIEDALLNYPDLNLFPVMKGVTPEQIKVYLESDVKFKKIVSTPDSFGKIIAAAFSLGKMDWLRNEVFLYMDEYHCYATEAYRKRILTPFDRGEVWKFPKKAFGSATPYPLSHPKFKELQPYKFTYKEKFGKITIINDSKPMAALHYMLTHPELFPGKVFIFFNSVTQSGEAITLANLKDVAVFCRKNERNLINLKDASIYFQHQPKDGEYKKFNFFSRRYDEGWALRADENATVILVTDVNIPHTMVGIPYQGFQAVGRLEQTPNKIYHITNNYCKDEMRPFNTIQRKWQYGAAKHVVNYNKHQEDCKMDGVENDGLMKKLIEPFAYVKKNNEAVVYPPKLDQVVCAEWIKEHYANLDTIQQTWESLNYDTELKQFDITPIVRIKKSNEEINRQVIERFEELINHPDKYVYEVAYNTIAKVQIEFELLFEAYYILTKAGIEKLGYNNEAMKAALINISNEKAEAKLRLILIDEFKLNGRYTNKEIKAKLRELYDQFGIRKTDGSPKTAFAEQLKEFGLFDVKECKVKDEHGKTKSGWEITRVNYTLKMAA